MLSDPQDRFQAEEAVPKMARLSQNWHLLFAGNMELFWLFISGARDSAIVQGPLFDDFEACFMTEVRRRMDRRQKYTPVGRCIYCGKEPPEVQLSLEHIIPESLGGMLELPAASCADCAKETHSYEGHCAGRLFAPIRSQLNFPSKRSLKNRVKKFTVVMDGVRRKIHQDEYPGLVISFVNGLPGILESKPLAEDYSGGVTVITLPEFGERLNRLRTKYRANQVSFQPEFHIEHLGKMLAKIAHAYAIAELGYGAFRPLLTDIILSRPPLYISHFVGGLRDVEPPQGNDLHSIEIDVAGLGMSRYVVVKIQLFADRKMPVYYVVAGELEAVTLLNG